MLRARFLLPSLLFGLLVSCDESSVKPAAASAVSRPVTEAAFLSAFVAASRSGRPDAVRALVHPATFQRGEKHARAFLAEWLSREAHRAIPETRRVTTTAIARDAPLPFEDSFVYAVRPTLSLQIDFDESPRRGVSMVRSVLVDDDGVWWLVVALPSEETLAKMRRSRVDADRTEQLAPDLARDIEEPVLSELKALLRDGKKISAIKRYREVSGEGLRVSKAVIDALDAEGRSVPTRGDSQD